MAETIAAFGLAANVLQFVDCGYGIVKTAHRLKSSENGATASNTEIELLARNLSKTMKEVQAGKVIPISPELSQSVSACVSLSDDLVQMLEGLKIDLADDSAWKRAKASVRVYRKASEVKALEERLGRFRTQICDHLNFGLLYARLSEVEDASDAYGPVPLTLSLGLNLFPKQPRKLRSEKTSWTAWRLLRSLWQVWRRRGYGTLQIPP